MTSWTSGLWRGMQCPHLSAPSWPVQSNKRGFEHQGSGFESLAHHEGLCGLGQAVIILSLLPLCKTG